MKKIFIMLTSAVLFTNTALAWEDTDVKSHFPIDHYFQHISDWISPTSPDYNIPVNDYESWQTIQMQNFYQHYFGSDSPWEPHYIDLLYKISVVDDSETRNLKSIETMLLHQNSNYKYTYDNSANQYLNPVLKTTNELGYDGYDAKAKPHSDQWILDIENNINLAQFDHNQQYDQSNRAIATNNLPARVLPTDVIYALNYQLPGEGKPFDYLQMSVIWAGTPVYILAETVDKAWYLVASPDVNAWVKSSGIARVDEHFIREWQARAKQGLVAITRTKLPIQDEEADNERFNGYVGSVFPLKKQYGSGYYVLLPPAKKGHGSHHAFISKEDAALMPLLPTPKNFVNVMSQLVNRSYGWGNLKFHNDCSGEMKNFYAPFGIWLPRNSASQVNSSMVLGTLENYSAYSAEERIAHLMENEQHKFTTLVYIGGHIMMYVGNYHNPPVALTYQNMWGLHPSADAIKNGDHDRRAVIGKSVLLPLLAQYPEDERLASPASRSIFKIMYLDRPKTPSFMQFNTWLSVQPEISLRALMVPE